jgi:chemotaxis protein MotA
MAKSTHKEHAFYHVIRVVIVAFIKGSPPSVAVEFGRRAIPGTVRPKFQELDDYIKNRAGAAEGAAPAEPVAPAAQRFSMPSPPPIIITRRKPGMASTMGATGR